jgi:hypothetical protein
MKYLCLVYVVEAMFDGMSQSEIDALEDEALAYNDVLEKSGHLAGRLELRPVAEARTVRVRDQALSVTDGPFAETKEQLGGFFIIEARDLDEAIQIAARSPLARIASIEVRPEWDLKQRVRDRAQG